MTIGRQELKQVDERMDRHAQQRPPDVGNLLGHPDHPIGPCPKQLLKNT